MVNKETIKKIFWEFWDNPLPVIYHRDLSVPLNPKKVVVIWGPRRSGKSFYFYHLAKELYKKGIPKNHVVYFNFEDDRLPSLQKGDLQDFLDSYFELFPKNKNEKLYFLLDEIQNINGWETFARRIYEKEGINVYITGSSSKLLSKEIATEMRGRSLSYALYPLSFAEFLKFKGEHIEDVDIYTHRRFTVQKYLEEYFTWGRFPEVVLENDLILKKKILQEYFQALLYQDLAERFSLDNTPFLEDLLKYLATNVNCLFSFNAYYKLVSQNIAVAKDTVYSYCQKATESYYFSYLPIFSYSLKAQRVNPKKINLLDNGIRRAAAFQFSEDIGRLAENALGRHFIEQENNRVFYWQGKHEVDFIVKNADILTAVNVCFGEEIAEREMAGLLEFKKRFPQSNLILLTKTKKETVGKIKLLPLYEYLLCK